MEKFSLSHYSWHLVIVGRVVESRYENTSAQSGKFLLFFQVISLRAYDAMYMYSLGTHS